MADFANKVAIPSSANRLKIIYGQNSRGTFQKSNLPSVIKFYCWTFDDIVKYIGISKATLHYYITNKPDAEQFVYCDLRAKVLITDTDEILNQLKTEKVKDIIKKIYFSTKFIQENKQNLLDADKILDKWSNKRYVRTELERERLSKIIGDDSTTIN